MSEKAAAQQAEAKGKREDDAEVDVILGDGFSIVDDVKSEEANKASKEEKTSTAKKTGADSSAKKTGADSSAKKTGADSEKTTGSSMDKKEKGPKEKEDVKAESSKKGDGKKDNPSKTVSDGKNAEKDEAAKEEANKSKAEETTDKSKSNDKADKTSPPKAEDMAINDSKDDSLVITAEDDIVEPENSDSRKTNTKSPVVNGSSAKKVRVPPSMWVSNIARRIKATDLKKVFSKHGKVITAKIVTNGKSYFGYVSMDSTKSIERCIKYLNHTRLGDKKISISSERPDAPKKKQAEVKKSENPGSAKKENKEDDSKDTKAKPKKEEKKSDEDGSKNEKDPLTLNVDSSKKKEDSPQKEKPVRKRIEAPKKDETFQLKREIKQLRLALDRTRRRLEDEQSHSKTYLMRSRRFQNSCKDLEDKLRTEKKAFDREREGLIKKNRIEQIKLEAEKDLLEKDRIDIRRRRDDLDRDIRKFNDMQRAAAAAAAAAERSHRSSRKSRSVSPPRNSSSAKRLKTSDMKHDAKKPRWTGERTRTPPPPPKLSPAHEGRGSKRDHDHFYDERGTRREAPVYVPSGSYHDSREPREPREGRHRPSFPPETKSAIVVPPRSGWPNSSLPSDWRSSGSDMPPPYNDRFREPYRAPPSGYSGPSRDAVPVYSSSSSRVSDPEYRRPVHYESAARKY